MLRVPERFKPDTFEAYYDEGLGCDIHSRMDRKVEMKRQGVVAIGDPVHGGRNYEPDAPLAMKKRALRGVQKADGPIKDPIIQTHDAEGHVVDAKRFSELPQQKDNGGGTD